MFIFLRNIHVLIVFGLFSVSPIFSQVFNHTTVHQHCERMLDLIRDDSPVDLACLTERVFYPAIIDLISNSVLKQSAYDTISIDTLCSIVGDVLYEIKGVSPCKKNITDAGNSYLKCLYLVVNQDCPYRNGTCYGVKNGVWFVVNTIIVLHIEAWRNCYDTMPFIKLPLIAKEVFGLEDRKFIIFWQDLLQKPEIVALIQEEYEHAEFIGNSNGIIEQRMLDLYACMIYCLPVSDQQVWSTLFPPAVLQKIIADWAELIPPTVGSTPLLSILMNMFAYTWTCLHEDCIATFEITKNFREQISKQSTNQSTTKKNKKNKYKKKKSKK